MKFRQDFLGIFLYVFEIVKFFVACGTSFYEG